MFIKNIFLVICWTRNLEMTHGWLDCWWDHSGFSAFKQQCVPVGNWMLTPTRSAVQLIAVRVYYCYRLQKVKLLYVINFVVAEYLKHRKAICKFTLILDIWRVTVFTGCFKNLETYELCSRNPIGGRNDGTGSPFLSGCYCIHPQTPCD
jgi:hypothetical protein